MDSLAIFVICLIVIGLGWAILPSSVALGLTITLVLALLGTIFFTLWLKEFT